MKINVSKWVCNFCNRTEDELSNIVVGPSDVAICDECVTTCAEIIGSASRPSDVKVKVTISNTGKLVTESAEDEAARIAAFARLAR